MRAYLIASGLLFLLVAVLHAARVVSEGAWHLQEPAFLLSTAAVIAMAGWAAYLLVRLPRRARR